MTRIMTKLVETFKYHVNTTQRDIDGGVQCDQNHCMEQVANVRALELATNGGASHVKVDGAKIRFRWKDHHWAADTPKIAKAALIKYDSKKMRHTVVPHKYSVIAAKGRKIAKMDPERRAKLDEIVERRRAAGIKKKPNRLTLRDRVIGLA